MNRVPALPLLASGYIACTIAAAILGGPGLLTALLGVLIASAATLRGSSTALVVTLGVTVAVASFAHWHLDHIDAQPPPPLASMTGTRGVGCRAE